MSEITAREKIEAKRAARKAELAKQEEAQAVVDLEALDALEVEHGDACVKSVDVPFTPGLTTIAIVRRPKTPEVKRYQDRIKPQASGQRIDPIKASEEVGLACMVYPVGEQRDALLAALPGLPVLLGNTALAISTGKAAEEGKD